MLFQPIRITASDGHVLNAFKAVPERSARGAIIVLHAVYGLTEHIGDVCARWAGDGYVAIAPALFDRISPDIVHEYSVSGAREGSASYGSLSREGIMQDIGACVAATHPDLPKVISGFCTGGTFAWIAAAHMAFAAHVNFYGSQIISHLDDRPHCPTIIHYGDSDHVVSRVDIGRIASAHPGLEVHIYPGAGHAFMNPDQASYNAPAADLAWARSLAFLETALSDRKNGK